MKILIVSQYFWPEYFRVNDLVEELKLKKDVEIEILTSYPNYPLGEVYEEFKKNPKAFSVYKNCKIYRVPQISRGKGSLTMLTLNYLTFLFSSLAFSFFGLRKKKYDYVFTVATSPIIVALTSILIAKFSKSKHVLWVLDLWPNVLHDLNIFKKKTFIYRLFEKIVIFIYKRTDIILCQSLTYKRNINQLNNSFYKKTIYFPSWPESTQKNTFQSFEKDMEIFSKTKFNIIFTGNIGDAQNFGSVIEIIKITKEEINWIVAGEGRRFSMLLSEKKKNSLKNLKLLGLLKFEELKKYVMHSDALLISLKSGETFDATIPGKFQTYLNYNKKIIGLIGGEVNDIINKYNIGIATREKSPEKVKKLIIDYLSKDHDTNKFNKSVTILNKIFSKERNINKLLNYFKLLIKTKKIFLKYLSDAKKIKFNGNFVISAFNLAFLGAYAENKILINNNFYIWPDGYYFKKISKLNLDKLPGRKLLNDLYLPDEIKEIIVLGNLSLRGRKYLEKKFNKKIVNIELPYGDLKDFKKKVPEFDNKQVCFITLPTPKQEILANYIQENQKYFKLFCFGAAINMASGEERPLPSFLEKIFFAETIWRLQYETLRRTRRLLNSFTSYLKGKKKNMYINFIFKKIDEE